MGLDASQLLGAKQLVGTTVNPRGYGWTKGVGRTGLAGMAIEHVVAKRAGQNTSQTPDFPRTAYLAVTDQEVALIKVGSGGLNGKLKDVLARVPRGDVASAKVSPGVLRTNLTISFTDGGNWEFEVSPLIRQKVVKVVHALGY